MVKRVLLQIGEGSFGQGFPVTLEIGEEGAPPTTRIKGQLPANLELEQGYQTWQDLYESLGSCAGLNSDAQVRLGARTIEAKNVSVVKGDCRQAAEALAAQFKTWLQSQAFRPICDRWLQTLHPTDKIRAILQTENSILQKLPWHLWDVLDQYSQAEMALSTPTFHSPAQLKACNRRVKILAIIGIDADDALLLQKLPDANVEVLKKPKRGQLNDKLWEQAWDIVFFAGHSYSRGKDETGVMVINETDTLTIEEVRYGLRKAIAGGLKLAIFNSCQGLGIARGLADLNIPQTIVMREPVPNYVAGKFLEYFLPAFAKGESLYLSVRSAREHLQGIEDRFLCATWLPVIYQNPAATPFTWNDLKRPKPNWLAPLATSLLVTAAVLGVRHVGLLLKSELFWYDHLLQARILVQPVLQPQNRDNQPDNRIIVITIDDKDLKPQENQPEDLKDRSLLNSTLVKLLDVLAKYQPRVVGLDLLRDPKSMSPEVLQRLRQTQNLIGICKARDDNNDLLGFPPPAGIPKERIGFNNAARDLDGVFRRQILFGSQHPNSPCPWPNGYSFSVQLALHYLKFEGIESNITPEGYLQLGTTIFKSLDATPGAYQRLDNLNGGGSQILLNYRPTRVQTMGLTEVLEEQADLRVLKDRLVLIGATHEKSDDWWMMPNSSENSRKQNGNARMVAGVFMQAHQTSQVISAVLDGRLIFWVWNVWGEMFWIAGWSVVGGVVVWWLKSPIRQFLGFTAILTSLYGVCFGFFLVLGGWIPLVPAFWTLVLTSGSVIACQTHSKK